VYYAEEEPASSRAGSSWCGAKDPFSRRSHESRAICGLCFHYPWPGARRGGVTTSPRAPARGHPTAMLFSGPRCDVGGSWRYSCYSRRPGRRKTRQLARAGTPEAASQRVRFPLALPCFHRLTDFCQPLPTTRNAPPETPQQTSLSRVRRLRARARRVAALAVGSNGSGPAAAGELDFLTERENVSSVAPLEGELRSPDCAGSCWATSSRPAARGSPVACS
jgi:hypothetical protein